jgi:hypothetical protein
MAADRPFLTAPRFPPPDHRPLRSPPHSTTRPPDSPTIRLPTPLDKPEHLFYTARMPSLRRSLHAPLTPPLSAFSRALGASRRRPVDPRCFSRTSGFGEPPLILVASFQDLGARRSAVDPRCFSTAPASAGRPCSLGVLHSFPEGTEPHLRRGPALGGGPASPGDKSLRGIPRVF